MLFDIFVYDDQNIFVKILCGELFSYKVFEDDKMVVIMDIMLCGDGYVLVILKVFLCNIFDIVLEDFNVVMVIVQKMVWVVVDVFDVDGIMIQQFFELVGG